MLRDHLGNTRVTFNANSTGTLAATDIKQINHYYPFGLNIDGPGFGAQGANHYQYNEKELNTDFGLNWNDYGARWYDASMGRWLAVDPLAEKFSRWSPYNGLNNPIMNIDPNGMSAMPGMEQTDANMSNAAMDNDIKQKAANVDYLARGIEDAKKNGGHWSADGNNDDEQQGEDGLKGDYTFDSNGKFTGFKATGKDLRLIIGGDVYSFHDPLTDVGAIEYNMKRSLYVFKRIKFIYGVSNGDIELMMAESHVTKGRWRLSIGWNSTDGRELDFAPFHLSRYLQPENLKGFWSAKELFEDRGPFFILPNSKTVYNTFDAGNWLWGNAMNRMGYSLKDTLRYAKMYNSDDTNADTRAITNGWKAYNPKP